MDLLYLSCLNRGGSDCAEKQLLVLRTLGHTFPGARGVWWPYPDRRVWGPLSRRLRCRAVARQRLPAGWRNVLLLAAASFIADVSGEMLMAVFPFLLLAQGATGLGLGIVGGATDALGHAVKVVGGRLSDRAGRRKPLILTGYLLAALSRIGIALAPGWGASLAFRASDRVGKGLRTAPRDALLAESAPASQRGRAFGLHRAADTAGALVGTAIALAATAALGASPATIVLVGAGIGLLTIIPLAGVHEIQQLPHSNRPTADEPASPRFRTYLAVSALYNLGNISYLFYLVRASDTVGSITGAIALYALFNAVYLALSYPIGALTDRIGRTPILAAGYLASAAAALLILAPGPAIIAAFIILGASYSAVDATGRALAADLAGSSARATRLGLYHGVTGAATLAGGIAAGLLWDHVGAWATFAFGAIAAAAAAPALMVVGRGMTAGAGE